MSSSSCVQATLMASLACAVVSVRASNRLARRRCRPCAGDLPLTNRVFSPQFMLVVAAAVLFRLRAHRSEPRGAAPRRAPRDGGHICECIRLSVRERPFQPLVDARVGHGLPAHASGRARRASEHAHGENGSRGHHLVRRANSGLRLPRRRSRYLQPQRTRSTPRNPSSRRGPVESSARRRPS